MSTNPDLLIPTQVSSYLDSRLPGLVRREVAVQFPRFLYRNPSFIMLRDQVIKDMTSEITRVVSI